MHSIELMKLILQCYEDEFTGRSEALESVDAVMGSTKELIREVDKSINHVVAFKVSSFWLPRANLPCTA